VATASLQQGIQALKQGNISTAIQQLEQACRDSAADPQANYQAQGWLVRAYLKGGKTSQATILCQQLTQTDNPKIRQWATETLDKLSPPETPPSASEPQLIAEAPAPATPERLAPEAAAQLLETGIKELRRRDFTTAIATLEDFMEGTDENYPNYAWGRTSLAKAYKGNEQYEEAIALGQAMLESDRESTRAWARDFIKTLPKDLINPVPEAAPVTEHNSADDSGMADIAGIRARSPIPGRKVQPRPAPTAAAAPLDMTPQILSALAHGSISLLASLLLFLLFADSIAANSLGLLRMAVPVIILVQTQDPTAKANAKEATNYVITAIAWLIFLSVSGFFIALGIVAMSVIFWPLIVLLGGAITVYMLAFSLWPIYAAIVVARQPEKVIRYPTWLVWHLL
jgi:tetratricopeptide (TPR) repeat protein